jgi:bacteriorhodopsin
MSNGNQALNVNSMVGAQADLAITSHGSDWYWTVCAIMTVSTFAYMGLAFTRPKTHRLFHYITAAITLVAAIAYFSMAAGLGQVPIQVEFMRPDSVNVAAAGTREIFYARYIDRAITTPLLLLDLLLTAGMPWPTVLITILADEVMVATGLVGALTSTNYKWGYWVFGMCAFFFVVYTLVFDARRNASALGPTVSRTYMMCGVLTIGVWFLYPIAWGLSEGGNVIHPDSEAIFYGILDVLAKPVFGFMLLFGHKNIDPADLGLNIRNIGEVTREKHPNGYQNGATNGHNGVTETTPQV